MLCSSPRSGHVCSYMRVELRSKEDAFMDTHMCGSELIAKGYL
jgi:hypothetical protein